MLNIYIYWTKDVEYEAARPQRRFMVGSWLLVKEHMHLQTVGVMEQDRMGWSQRKKCTYIHILHILQYQGISASSLIVLLLLHSLLGMC